MIHRLSIDGSQRILPKEFRILPGPGLEEIASFIVQLKAFNCVRLPYSCPAGWLGWLGWLVQWWSFWPLYRTYIGLIESKRTKEKKPCQLSQRFGVFCRGRSQAPFRRCLGILAAGYQGFDLFFPWGTGTLVPSGCGGGMLGSPLLLIHHVPGNLWKRHKPLHVHW